MKVKVLLEKWNVDTSPLMRPDSSATPEKHVGCTHPAKSFDFMEEDVTSLTSECPLFYGFDVGPASCAAKTLQNVEEAIKSSSIKDLLNTKSLFSSPYDTDLQGNNLFLKVEEYILKTMRSRSSEVDALIASLHPDMPAAENPSAYILLWGDSSYRYDWRILSYLYEKVAYYPDFLDMPQGVFRVPVELIKKFDKDLHSQEDLLCCSEHDDSYQEVNSLTVPQSVKAVAAAFEDEKHLYSTAAVLIPELGLERAFETVRALNLPKR